MFTDRLSISPVTGHIDDRPRVARYLTVRCPQHVGTDLDVAVGTAAGPVTGHMPAMIRTAGHHRHEQCDRVVVLIRVDVVEKVTPQRRDDVEAGHRCPCAVEIRPASLGVGLEDDLREGVQDALTGTIRCNRSGDGVLVLRAQRQRHRNRIVTLKGHSAALS